MAGIYVYANQKGGVGKTTSALNIGAYLALAGHRVLLVDFDPQGNLSSGIGADTASPGIYELLSGSVAPLQVVQETVIPGLSLIPATVDLSGATVELASVPDREQYLRRAIAPYRGRYDFIMIDCPPSLGILTVNALYAADRVLIPLQCEYFALEGLAQLMNTVRAIQQYGNPKLRVGGIFFTMYDSRTRLAQDVVRSVVGHYGKTVFRTIIPRNVRLSEAPSHGVPISIHDPSSVGAMSYQKLAQEVADRV